MQVDALKRLQTESAAKVEALLLSLLNRAFCGELSCVRRCYGTR
jgi:hypothetical protein